MLATSRITRRSLCTLLLTCGLAASASLAQTAAQRTFTYQGRLTSAGLAVNGSVNVTYKVYAALTGGLPLASGTVAANATDGVFTIDVPLASLGLTQFTGSERYLELTVQQGLGPAQILTPRQAMRPAPYALYALNNAFTLDPSGNAIFSSSSAQVGIGTASPTAGRPVTIQARPAGDLLQFRNSAGAERWHLALGTGNGLNFSQSGVADNRLFLSTGGFVGINTDTPRAALEAVGDVRSNGFLLHNSGGNLRWGMSIDGGGGMNISESSVADYRMYFKAGGDIGVGTNAPQAKLDVNGRIRCGSLQITGGSDIAEPYDVSACEDAHPIPGMVVVIDSSLVGRLRVSAKAYDHAVAGIISGANGINPGLTLTQDGSVASGQFPIANVGRVWCYADADANGPIIAGDLLTTSATPGHAMTATDTLNRGGAVLGKAMSGLDKGKGMVLVLVGLQ